MSIGIAEIQYYITRVQNYALITQCATVASSEIPRDRSMPRYTHAERRLRVH